MTALDTPPPGGATPQPQALELDSKKKYSWADPAIGITHLVVRGSTAEAKAFLDLRPDEDYGLAMYQFALQRHPMILIHEWLHILQVASYPWLFIRAARAYHQLAAPFAAIRANRGRLDLPLQFVASREDADSRLLETIPVRIWIDAHAVRAEPVLTSLVRGVITEQDLVEEDATVAEYQIDVGGRGNGVSYRRWLTERPHYQRAFSLLSQHMSDDAAFSVLPVLVRVAFRTNRPIAAFAGALGTVLLYGPDTWLDPESTQILEDGLTSNALNCFGIADDASTDFQSPAISDRPGFVTDDRFEQLVSAATFPVSPLSRWSLADDANGEGTPFLLRVLRQPWQHFGRRASQPSRTLLRYLPPGTTVELDDPDFPVGKTMFYVSPSVVSERPPGENGLTYGEVLIHMYQLRLVSNALMGEREPRHTCPHDSCRVHASRLCRGWLPIPTRFQECDFPSFLEQMSKHRLDPTGKVLVPMMEEAPT